MLLVIDVGNTNTVFGVFKGAKLIRDWRIRTEKNATEDEVCVLVTNLFAASHINISEIEKTVIASVVPAVERIYNAFCKKYLNHAPLWVDATSMSMPNLYDTPSDVGADRIVNAIAAYRKYKTSLIVIDFGTATTFDVISEKGEYLGGAITPGIVISSEALFQKASKLPRVDLLKPPEEAIGKNTVGSMKSGILLGYASLVDGMVARIKKEMGGAPKVIATGGLALLMQKISETIESVEPDLTLEGLRVIGNGS